MKGFVWGFSVAVFLTLFLGPAAAVERFPPPDFVESGHQLPVTMAPQSQARNLHLTDVVVLLVALVLASCLALGRRSRNALLVLSVLSLLYFGFYRRGCVCAIGSIQNVVLALADSSYVLPLSVLAFFLLPLLFALLFGRTFCAAVCPHGALQDLLVVKPLRVPAWLEHGLRIIPYLYLGAAVLLAATGGVFLICQYDPFVGFFRLSGSRNMLLFGGAFLVLGLFIGRPYCRFMCPYGALLGMLSWASRWHVSVTPDKCTQCRLCEDSCPFGAIKRPRLPASVEDRTRARRRLAWVLVVLPVLVLLGGWLGGMVSGPLSSSHPTVRLAERVWTESEGQSAVASDEVTAFRLTGVPVERLYTEALGVRGKFRAWGWILGGFIGLVVGVKLTQLSIWRTQVDYEADRVRCVSCARCFETCPYEHVRRGTYVGVPPGTAGGGSGEGPSARGTDATAAKESGPGETGGHRT